MSSSPQQMQNQLRYTWSSSKIGRQENRLLHFSVIFQSCFSFSSWHRKILGVSKWNTMQNSVKSGGSCKHLETWITVKKWHNSSLFVRVQRLHQKKPNPCLSCEVSNQQRRYRVCLQIQQTILIYFQNDQLVIVSVLHYCPERKKHYP